MLRPPFEPVFWPRGWNKSHPANDLYYLGSPRIGHQLITNCFLSEFNNTITYQVPVYSLTSFPAPVGCHYQSTTGEREAEGKGCQKDWPRVQRW
jgi:hypothetical protein